jgi:hypothetical protein
MESLTRLVSESLARHGFDRPLDYRRLRWSRWFRCESHHSLLFVPSKPGVFALAEEIMDLGPGKVNVGRVAPGCPGEQSSAESAWNRVSDPARSMWDRVSDPVGPSNARRALADSTPAAVPRRMLAVTQFFEDDDMAFVLDRMLSHQNPMSARLSSGRYFVRFVVIEDQIQRRSICSALNQWIVSTAEKATGIGSHFASSLELTPATEYLPQPNEAPQDLFAKDSPKEDGEENVAPSPASASATDANVGRTLLSATPDTITSRPRATAPHLNSGAATNIHCPSPFPSGF